MGWIEAIRSRLLLTVAMVAVALNFRTPIASVPPVLEAIRADLSISYAVVGLLTTIPTLCFGLFAFAAPLVSNWTGRERGVLWLTALTAASIGVRIWGTNAVVLFGSALVAGIAIAIAQTLLPAIVQERYEGYEGLGTGLYTSSMAAGAALAAAGTAWLWDVVGSWPGALAAWAPPTFLAVVLWAPIAFGSDRSSGPNPSQTRSGIPWTSGWAWLLTLFFAAEAHLFFSLLTWLSPRYVSLGWGAGEAALLLTVFLSMTPVGSFVIGTLSDRRPDRRPWIVFGAVLVLVGLVGATFVPLSYPWVFAVLLGLGNSALFSLALTLPIDFAASSEATDRLSAMVIGVGYAISSAGPFAVGALRDLVGDFQFAFLTMVIVALLMLLSAVLFDPDVVIDQST